MSYQKCALKVHEKAEDMCSVQLCVYNNSYIHLLYAAVQRVILSDQSLFILGPFQFRLALIIQ